MLAFTNSVVRILLSFQNVVSNNILECTEYHYIMHNNKLSVTDTDFFLLQFAVFFIPVSKINLEKTSKNKFKNKISQSPNLFVLKNSFSRYRSKGIFFFVPNLSTKGNFETELKFTAEQSI